MIPTTIPIPSTGRQRVNGCALGVSGVVQVDHLRGAVLRVLEHLLGGGCAYPGQQVGQRQVVTAPVQEGRHQHRNAGRQDGEHDEHHPGRAAPLSAPGLGAFVLRGGGVRGRRGHHQQRPVDEALGLALRAAAADLRVQSLAELQQAGAVALGQHHHPQGAVRPQPADRDRQKVLSGLVGWRHQRHHGGPLRVGQQILQSAGRVHLGRAIGRQLRQQDRAVPQQVGGGRRAGPGKKHPTLPQRQHNGRGGHLGRGHLGSTGGLQAGEHQLGGLAMSISVHFHHSQGEEARPRGRHQVVAGPPRQPHRGICVRGSGCAGVAATREGVRACASVVREVCPAGKCGHNGAAGVVVGAGQQRRAAVALLQLHHQVLLGLAAQLVEVLPRGGEGSRGRDEVQRRRLDAVRVHLGVAGNERQVAGGAGRHGEGGRLLPERLSSGGHGQEVQAVLLGGVAVGSTLVRTADDE
mmetsp:Transcript_24500/g.33580  ORF Transcript_24500/g.33580 Transcript_24500/m.33580 type:complete len:465 (+) Transcript_24500:247-1641(+)